MHWESQLGLFDFQYNIFVLGALVSDLPSPAVAASWAGHHLDVDIGALPFFDALYSFLDIAESVTLGHLNSLFVFCFESVLEEVSIPDLLALIVSNFQPIQDHINITIRCLIFQKLNRTALYPRQTFKVELNVLLAFLPEYHLCIVVFQQLY